jgi:hypothetical protein
MIEMDQRLMFPATLMSTSGVISFSIVRLCPFRGIGLHYDIININLL